MAHPCAGFAFEHPVQQIFTFLPFGRFRTSVAAFLPSLASAALGHPCPASFRGIVTFVSMRIWGMQGGRAPLLNIFSEK
jgi:hypothetical protein